MRSQSGIAVHAQVTWKVQDVAGGPGTHREMWEAHLVGDAELGKGGDDLGGRRVDVEGLKAVGLADAVVAQIQCPAQATLFLRPHRQGA